MCCEGIGIMLLDMESAAGKHGAPAGRQFNRPLTGRSVVIALGLFFGVMFLANFALIYFALSTLHGEELENPYDASQVYNQRIAAARAQDELGWTANVTTREEGGSERVVVDFRDRQGATVAGLEVRARFVHPFDKGADREAALISDGGAYEGVAGPLHAGRWMLILEALQDGHKKFVSQNKIVIGDSASGS